MPSHKYLWSAAIICSCVVPSVAQSAPSSDPVKEQRVAQGSSHSIKAYTITGQEWGAGKGASREAHRGRLLIMDTKTHMPQNVGNSLSCTHCHQEGGVKPNAAPFVGITHRFPMYRSRIGRAQSIEERVQDCFERSLSGVAPDVKSPEVKAIVAYMTHLSRDVPKGAELVGRGIARLAPPRETPNAQRGAQLYASKCMACHMANGEGIKGPDNKMIFPALWGDQAFNIAAGMARLNTAAAFIKHNMPKGQEGTLSDQEAYDIAQYVTRQARPDYAKKHLDWPQGGRPEDARY